MLANVINSITLFVSYLFTEIANYKKIIVIYTTSVDLYSVLII